MKNYLAMIRRADFVDLFKYGSLHLNRDLVRMFVGTIEELAEKKCIFDDLTRYANAFESTFSYLFIHYTKNCGRCNDVHISDVKHVFPLDYEAKRELTQAFDTRIRIENPLWSEAVIELQKKHTVEGCRNGAFNLWKIFDIEYLIEDIEYSYITSSILKEVVDELYENRRPKGNLPIWVYAMRYERHAFYPSNVVGCVMDAVHVLFNKMNQQEIDAEAIENTNIMKFLYHCASFEKIQLNDVLREIAQQESVSKILEYAKEIEPSVDLLKTLTLFFIYRNQYKEGFRYEEKWKLTGKQYGKEFAVAAYILGCVLQHEHTYDCLYEHISLDIFKKKEFFENVKNSGNVYVESKLNKQEELSKEFAENPQHESCHIESVDIESMEPVIRIEESNDSSNSYQGELFVTEGKKLKNPKTFRKTSKSKKTFIANTEEEALEYKNLGYVEYSETAKSKNNKTK